MSRWPQPDRDTEATWSIFEDTNPRASQELSGDSTSRSTVLPDLQRDFVWDPADHSGTHTSRSRITTRPAACSESRTFRSPSRARRASKGAPPLSMDTATPFLVLDGQPALTLALPGFLWSRRDRYLCFWTSKKLLKGNDFEDAIFHERTKSDARSPSRFAKSKRVS